MKKDIKLNFFPESERFAATAEEYQKIWDEEGGNMIRVLEETSGLRFDAGAIAVMVFEGVSQAKGNLIKMRASYLLAVKKARLVHELGHILLAQLKYRPDNSDEHGILYLFLYEVWEKLYGKTFADRAVEEEKKLKGLYDYGTAWNRALSLSKKERVEQWAEIRSTSQGGCRD